MFWGKIVVSTSKVIYSYFCTQIFSKGSYILGTSRINAFILQVLRSQLFFVLKMLSLFWALDNHKSSLKGNNILATEKKVETKKILL